MNNFSKWFSRILGAEENTEKGDLVDEYLNDSKDTLINVDLDEKYEEKTQKLLDVSTKLKPPSKDLPPEEYQKEVDKYKEQSTAFTNIKRDLMIKNVKQKIQKYDNQRKTSDEKYTSYSEGLSKEVENEEDDKKVDKALDVILEKKLDVYVEKPEFITDKILAELDEQSRIYKTREQERADQINALRGKLSEYDNEKKKTDENYASFEEICLENNWESVDKEMLRVLQEKLGVYDFSQETDEVKCERKERQLKLDAMLKKYQEEKGKDPTFNIPKRSSISEEELAEDKFISNKLKEKLGVEDTNTNVSQIEKKPKQIGTYRQGSFGGYGTSDQDALRFSNK